MCLPQVAPCEPIHIKHISYDRILTHIHCGVTGNDNHHKSNRGHRDSNMLLTPLIVTTSLAPCTVAAAATTNKPSRQSCLDDSWLYCAAIGCRMNIDRRRRGMGCKQPLTKDTVVSWLHVTVCAVDALCTT
jgi:hypothetical protein